MTDVAPSAGMYVPLVNLTLLPADQNVRATVASILALAPPPAFADITGKPTTLSGYGIIDAQPLDADLTAIAALGTTAYGRGFLVLADASAAQAYIGASGSGTVTSVNLTAPAAGITVSGGPITTSGSITLSLADDLASLEALSGTNTIYYRSGVSTWTAVTIGANMTFVGGTLDSIGGGGGGSVTSFSSGNLSPLFTTNVATATTTPALSFSLSNQSANTIFAGPSSGAAAAPTFRSISGDDIPSISWTKLTDSGQGFIYMDAGSPILRLPDFSELTGLPTTLSGYGITDAQPLDADLTALASLTGTNTIYYRSGANTWSPVTIGPNMTFSGGTLDSTGGGGGGAALFVGRSAKTSAYTVVAGDKGYLIDCTTGTFTISLTSSAALGDGFFVAIYNSGSGVITIDPASTQQIREGSSSTTSKDLAQGDSMVLFCNGSDWYAVSTARFWYQPFAGSVWTNNQLFVNNNSNSTSSADGALVVSGGLGVGGRVNIGSLLWIESTQASTSTTTGCTRLFGGLGVAGATYTGVGVSALSTTSINANRSFGVFTNEGAVGRVDIALPAAAAGIQYTYVVQDADGFRITASTSNTIRMSSGVTASAGYIQSTTVGSYVVLVSINATEWMAVSWGGTWSLDGTATMFKQTGGAYTADGTLPVTTGYVTMPDSGGTPRKFAIIT